MHALLLTFLTIAAQPGTNFTPAAHTSEIVPVQHTADCGCNNGGSGEYSEGYVSGGDYGYGGGGYYEGGIGGAMRAKKGPMPQTCYAPRYGCYPGNSRYTHRYPAFHDSYYRRPYAYRHTFEYPWHAELHEPTSLWSYNVPLEEDTYFDQDVVPVPPIGANPQQQPPAGVRSARRPADFQQQPQQQQPQQSQQPQQQRQQPQPVQTAQGPAPIRQQQPRQESPRALGVQTSAAPVLRQNPTEELPSIVTRSRTGEQSPQPTPAVRPPVVELAPVVPMSDAAAELAQSSFEEGSNTLHISDLMQQ